MKKVWEFIKSFFSGFGGEVVETGVETAIDKGGDLMSEGLEKFYETNPKTCAAMVSSLYVWIDTVVEDLADKSKTKYDDKGVDEVKLELEEFALSKGFVLTNLDTD